MASTQCTGVDCDYAKLHKLGADTVTILVGTEGKKEEFLILADLAKQHSQAIATKLETLTDTEDTRVHMPEYAASHFSLFVSFIYTGRLYTCDTTKKNPAEWRFLCELWILGQGLRSTTLKDAVTDAMIGRRAVLKEFSSHSHIALVEYLQTKEQTRRGIGKLLVDTAATCHQHEIYTDARSTNPGCLQFFGDVLMGVDRIRRGVESEKEVLLRTRNGPDCVYHEHGNSEICYKKMFPATQDSVRQPQHALPQVDNIMTEVRVGTGEVEQFMVRKELATRHSTIIKKALDPSSGWKEAKENVIRLPEESPEAFQVFVTFLDTGVIHLNHLEGAKSDAAQGDDLNEDKEWNSIAEVWLLSDRIDSVTLKDAIVDKVISLVRDSGKVPTSLHRPIFKGSVSKSGMRKLLTDIAVYSWFPGTLADQPGDPECADYFRDVGVGAMNRMARIIQGQILSLAPYDRQDVECHYHDHDAEGKPCYKTMFG